MKFTLSSLGILLFLFSSIIAQNESDQFIQCKIGMKSTDAFAYNRFTLVYQDNILTEHHSFLNLSGQALVGSTLAMGFSILPLGAGVADALSRNSTKGSQTALGILAISSYLFGAAVGVYWIASYENPNLSFWGTVGYSAIGGSVGVVLVSILATNYTTIPTIGAIIVALTPLIGSMVYASFISDWPVKIQSNSFYKNSLSHKDLVEQSQIINIELLKIKL